MILISPPRRQLLLVVHWTAASRLLVLRLGGRSFRAGRIMPALTGLKAERRELQGGLARAGLLRNHVGRVAVL